MDLEEIKALPVEEVATPMQCFIYGRCRTWSTRRWRRWRWGFHTGTQIIWVKDKIGMGQWARQQHEILLIGRRGNFPPPPTAVRSSSVMLAPRTAHSAKPAIFAEMIERWYPGLAKIELFRRRPARPGWVAWGNEAKPAEIGVIR